ncbi:putative B3 domain-containing protein REM15 isoform X2 [Panicum virgatum]|uniref:putative B3 domain-containing protein REM15 isoform X2 n=1 Tax=Panicum virgatum TaxID=38727 RepID=UPI0019D67FF5|nr:putative B3 domain-containing protein REM15 isoform X2 [Panicum virgatum]
MNRPVYKVGPPSWIKKEISGCTLWKRLTIAGTFCKAIGLIWRTSEVTLRTTADKDHGHRSWQVGFLFYENRNSGELTRGWRRFCTDNMIKEGDICTFNIIETALWHVDITCHSLSDTEKEDVPSSSRKCKCEDKKPDGEENSKRTKGPTTSLNEAPSSIVYEIGPPSWLKREISAHILSAKLYVPRNFYKAIGLNRSSEITLRTTTNEDHGLRSWQVHFLVYRNRGTLTRGWRTFWADNMIKEGDICTFNVIETTLWHVDITRHREDQGTISNELEKNDKMTLSDMEKEDVPSSSRKRKCEDKKPDGEENSKRTKGPTTSLNKAPASIVYDIGPQSLFKTEISAYILSLHLSVPRNFWKATGLCRTSNITLRTTANEDHGLRSWQVRFLVSGNHGMLTRGWRTFLVDNRIKEGDICTFKIIKTTLRHVDIMRHG